MTLTIGNEDLFRFSDEPRAGGVFEFFAGVDRGDDHGHVFRRNVR